LGKKKQEKKWIKREEKLNIKTGLPQRSPVADYMVMLVWFF